MGVHARCEKEGDNGVRVRGEGRCRWKRGAPVRDNVLRATQRYVSIQSAVLADYHHFFVTEITPIRIS